MIWTYQDGGLLGCGYVAGAINGAPTMGAYCIVFMTVGCSVPDLALVGGGFISPAIYRQAIWT
ncbi:hypothetical protein AB840_10530 [Megasphaera cerevisiae DSM 20462]|uniref:Uncharacterized protein n=1 Tax=Megasphaera cerevisiae DSM 20462 TaxID=1122219 RepID=A0A0J6ZM50_9FIRM|nr:hypothetical protein AB840_10530 [Megasphaera cerevisiae DSM 20462]OKY52452.1 hypothetical protein BSR42_12780 [Megasphaera cerevisiae]